LVLHAPILWNPSVLPSDHAVRQWQIETLSSPDERITVSVNDNQGLHYGIAMDGKTIMVSSAMGLEFEGGAALGPGTRIVGAKRKSVDTTWTNPFGPNRKVKDKYREMTLDLTSGPYRFGVVVRAYDSGVAFRYQIPKQRGLESYVVTDERTEFLFENDFTCWAGGYSDCAENQYPERKLSALGTNPARPHVLPLLVKLPGGYANIAESDLRDWSGMFALAATPGAQGQARFGARVALARRKDGRGRVVGEDRRESPWRVIMLSRRPEEIVESELIATLATPSKIRNTGWIKPGVSAWDSWWTGLNPTQPRFRGLNARGDTRSHKEYIDFASEMGFTYQLIDWFWYEPMNNVAADLTKPAAHVDIPELVRYAKDRRVRLILWVDSRDLERQGFDKVFDQVAAWGFAGVKVDFMNSDSQETVKWYEDALEAAARRRLLVDFHGAYKPTGLARTYPNYITQEGVLGNEYNKIRPGACTPLHTITLPFTRGVLGPNDFTPGGFLNRTPEEFRIGEPAQVVGTRARQLAMTVVYFSPLLVLCDSPTNYRGQPGVEFFRKLPTVWDETRVLSADVAGHIVIARRSGDRWYLAAMNGDNPLKSPTRLSFLGKGKWKLSEFADAADSGTKPESIALKSRSVTASDRLELNLARAGGYAAILTKE
jgi:alpha-glucosidase